MAGVSEGTVDRVLHNRGEVSLKSKEAVNKVLEEINYSPNLLARSLASRRHYLFICLIPAHQPNDYWEIVERGFDLAARDFLQYNIVLKKYYFNQFDVNSFLSVSEEVTAREPDGVIMSPIFREETLRFTGTLDEKGIPYSFIDSMIEDAGFLTYYGQNSFESGYVAAKLLLNSLPENSRIIVLRTLRKGAVSNQTIARKNGFMKYMQDNHLTSVELINVEMRDGDDAYNLGLLKQVFDRNEHIRAAITFNSKVYRLAKYLEEMKHTDVRLIGYDLLEKNIEYLKRDVISFLIGQRPEKQAYLTVRDMCSAIILKQDVRRIDYVPVDILIKENIEDYLRFSE